MADGITSMYPHPPVENLTIKNAGVDPSVLAMLGNRNNDGMFGGNGLVSLLIGAFLFGGNRGMWGLGGNGGAVAAAEGITTAKDVSAQLNTFQSWAQTNAQALANQLCTSSANIINAVNGTSDRLFQSFVAQAQAQTAQLNDIGRDFTDQLSTQTQTIQAGFGRLADGNGAILGSMAAGFSAGQLAECATQNLIQSTSCDVKGAITAGNYALAQQLAACCCENRLAIANQNALIEKNTAAISNQINVQTCEIKGAIAADGAATRALINANATDALRSELADAKSAVRDAQLVAALRRGHCVDSCGNGNGNGNSK